MKTKTLFDPSEREEERLWREERRAREERRVLIERSWRENPAVTQGVRATCVRKAEWLAAMRWRRQIQVSCARSQLTFTQWLVLDGVRQLVKETDDDVIQNEIAARLELDQATISEVVQRLEARNLVSRGGDITNKAWRVHLTDEAEQLLRELDAPLDAVSSTVR